MLPCRQRGQNLLRMQMMPRRDHNRIDGWIVNEFCFIGRAIAKAEFVARRVRREIQWPRKLRPVRVSMTAFIAGISVQVAKLPAPSKPTGTDSPARRRVDAPSRHQLDALADICTAPDT